MTEILIFGELVKLAPIVIAEMSGDRSLLPCRQKAITLFESQHPEIEVLRVHSMRSAMNQLQGHPDDAVLLSAGDTGLIVREGLRVGRISRKVQPVLAAVLPRANGQFVCADVGAGKSLLPEQSAIEWSALAGSVVAEELFDVPAKVGLFNIGEEDGKGGPEIETCRVALTELLGDSFVGNAEFHNVIMGVADITVLVTSPVLGNNILKVAEGTTELLRATARAKSEQSPWFKLQGLLYRWISRNLLADLDWRHFCGAYLLGLNRPILKTHGRSDERAFYAALERAASKSTFRIWSRFKTDECIKRWLGQ